jgi:hypothetical protein
MDQQTLIFDDVLDALGEVVRALGGPKSVGPAMRPELPADQAAQWMRDCLNANRRERFDPAQVVWILRKGREATCHAAINFLCDEAGYARPAPLDPKDEAAQLQRRFIQAVQDVQALGSRIERLTKSPLQAVGTKAG